MARNIGGFVSCAGGLHKAIENGNILNVNTIMLHPTPPQRWNTKAFDEEAVIKYNEAKAKSKIEKVYFHGIYLVNLANPDKQKFHLSKLSLVYYLDLLARVKAEGVVFHTGSFKDIGEDEGFERVIYGLNWIFENLTDAGREYLENTKTPRLLLECAAGAGSVIGDKMEELRRIYDGIKDEHKNKLGFCLDTQHMYASGYDLVNDIDGVAEQIDSILSIDKVTAVHFNDSKTELGSNRDRHENLGEGLIGEKGMKGFLNHPKLKKLDFIMETPALGEFPEGALRQVEILKSWAVE
jgi:deoxyribonuclease-4